ncbi:polysaccharide pyruvyl transferase family protein [Clostridium sp.]|jgi:hypothetical protein|uniref:polysaccharide pyruvyl transferase family protein n=1 Tax=Clostridium sp. TaxID=1506 RepID=UPI0025865592|nr:polysaccharide pyruvyl transferase family protein [Clostridium sp.]MDF2504968.1 hypothetical protein [Clostridium sp.]
MKKNIGILYDNISGNTGDVAIGLSLRKILTKLNVGFDELVAGNFNSSYYDCIIIGGGHLIRKDQDFFYDKFKVPGNHILNSMGVVDRPTDLNYLNDYRYVTFRSTGDREKVNYINKESFIVPCTTMLLDDITDLQIKIERPSIGIHMLPNIISKEEENLFIEWLSKLPYDIYFIPITHYNNDYDYMNYLSRKIPNSYMLPIMKPLEIFTLIGKFKFVITCSLHGSIFSYIHNVPFILMDQEKSRFFLEDRNLEKYLFSSLEDIKRLSEEILSTPVDYSASIIKDKSVLENHVKIIKDSLPKNIYTFGDTPKINITDELIQSNHQINFLQMKINEFLNKNADLNDKLDNLLTEVSALNKTLAEKENHISNLNVELKNTNEELNVKQNKILDLESKTSYLGNKLTAAQNELGQIYNSKGWKMLSSLYNVEDKITNITKSEKK